MPNHKITLPSPEIRFADLKSLQKMETEIEEHLQGRMREVSVGYVRNLTRQTCRELHMGQKEFANHIHISYTSLCMFLNGKRDAIPYAIRRYFKIQKRTIYEKV